MTSITLLHLLFICTFTCLGAELCAPADIKYTTSDYIISLSWSYDENCTSGQAIVIAEPGCHVSYDLNGYGAMINTPYLCSTYKVGVMPYSDGGVTGPIEYLTVETGAPSYITMEYVSIRKNDTYIRAEWAPDEAAKNCFEDYLVNLYFTNYISPVDTESLQHMSMFHVLAATSYDIMSVEDCVNNTIKIEVAPLYNYYYTGESLTDTYTCD